MLPKNPRSSSGFAIIKQREAFVNKNFYNHTNSQKRLTQSVSALFLFTYEILKNDAIAAGAILKAALYAAYSSAGSSRLSDSRVCSDRSTDADSRAYADRSADAASHGGDRNERHRAARHPLR